MNARFAAVALSSCLSLMLASELYPWPSWSNLIAPTPHRASPGADSSTSAAAPQATAPSQVMEVARVVEATPAATPSPAVATPQADVTRSEAAQATETSPIPESPAVEAVPEVKRADTEPTPATPPAVETAQASAVPQISEPPAATETPRAADTQQAAQEQQAPPAEQDTKPQQAAVASPSAPAPQTADTQQTSAQQTDAADIPAARSLDPTTAAPVSGTSAAMAPAADQPDVADRTDSKVDIKADAKVDTKIDTKIDTKLDLASASPTDMLDDVQPLPERPAELPPSNPLAPFNSAVTVDDCLVDGCVDRYLWALYQRAPKEDKIRVDEQRMVAVKRKGKVVMVSRTFSKLVDEDFAWKDQKASEKAGLPIDTYVIGGMDTEFRLKLFRILHAADIAGLAPGITSGFRDDYRQSIASGLKAANNRSFHGGSTRGGYGHGLAADVVSVNGATRAERYAATETLWKWIDANAQQFGVGRPYLGYDPPHLAPTDGDEWARHHHEPTVRVAAGKKTGGKKAARLAAQHARGAAKRVASGKSKAGTVRAARDAPVRTAQAKLHS